MAQPSRQRSMAPAVFGVLLMVVGLGALAGRQLGFDVLPEIGRWGWPLFVIVPGVALLGASFLVPRPGGVALGVAGGVVTTVGGILLYQSQTSHWESWAYAWALIPAGVGGALVIHGMLAAERRLLMTGTWLGGIALVVFLAGAWFFEGIFSGDQRFADVGNAWPVAVIVLGAVLLLRGVLRPSPRPSPQPDEPQQP